MQCFFNLAGAVHDPDVTGIEMPSIAEARLEAVRYIGQLVSDSPDIVWTGQEVRVEVTDAERVVLFTVVVVGLDAQAAAERF